VAWSQNLNGICGRSANEYRHVSEECAVVPFDAIQSDLRSIAHVSGAHASWRAPARVESHPYDLQFYKPSREGIT
jgi:hypothetical protein